MGEVRIVPLIKIERRIVILRSEKNWYRCLTRDEMKKLIDVGFDYTNFRKDRFNNGNITYYFERTEKLEKYLESTARV